MSSGSSSSRRRSVVRGIAWFLTIAWATTACLAPAAVPESRDTAAGRTPLLAVFPVEHLTGKPAPLEDTRQLLVGQFQRAGLRLVDDAVLEALITKHRVRYTGGLDEAFALALRREIGVDAVVIPSLELHDAGVPPRVGLFARLVSTGDTPRVLWADGAGGAGDDAPGLLGIGLVDDSRKLLEHAVAALTRSLVGHLSASEHVPPDHPVPRKFRPRIVYRADRLDAQVAYSIAIVPFFNKSERPNAGEILGLQLMRALAGSPRLAVVEPGVLREQLLRFRIIMNEGVSLGDTETILNAVNADLVLNGEVLEYQESRGVLDPPRIDFSVLFIERRSRRVLYSSYSQNTGADRVFFFDYGRVNTAHVMAAHMAGAIRDHLLLAAPTAPVVPKEGR